jgi:hypothetical protein
MIRLKKANQLPIFAPAELHASDTAGGYAKALDQRFGCLHITKLRLNLDEMAVILIRRIGGERGLGLFQFPM